MSMKRRVAWVSLSIFVALIWGYVFLACPKLDIGVAMYEKVMPPIPKVKSVVMIIASKNFRDEEYSVPRKILERAGYKVVVASSSTRAAKGMLGLVVKPDIPLNRVKVNAYDAIIFVGGTGAKEYWDNSTAHQIAKQAAKYRKILGAICIAPVTLAKAGVLKGVKATVWSSEANQLKAAGAVYTGKAVTRDGNIITANGPGAAKEFGETILKALKSVGKK